MLSQGFDFNDLFFMDTTSCFPEPPFYFDQVQSLAAPKTERPLQGKGATAPEASLLTGAAPAKGAPGEPGPAGNTPGVARGPAGNTPGVAKGPASNTPGVER